MNTFSDNKAIFPRITDIIKLPDDINNKNDNNSKYNGSNSSINYNISLTDEINNVFCTVPGIEKYLFTYMSFLLILSFNTKFIQENNMSVAYINKKSNEFVDVNNVCMCYKEEFVDVNNVCMCYKEEFVDSNNVCMCYKEEAYVNTHGSGHFSIIPLIYTGKELLLQYAPICLLLLNPDRYKGCMCDSDIYI